MKITGVLNQELGRGTDDKKKITHPNRVQEGPNYPPDIPNLVFK